MKASADPDSLSNATQPAKWLMSNRKRELEYVDGVGEGELEKRVPLLLPFYCTSMFSYACIPLSVSSSSTTTSPYVLLFSSCLPSSSISLSSPKKKRRCCSLNLKAGSYEGNPPNGSLVITSYLLCSLILFLCHGMYVVCYLFLLLFGLL